MTEIEKEWRTFEREHLVNAPPVPHYAMQMAWHCGAMAVLKTIMRVGEDHDDDELAALTDAWFNYLRSKLAERRPPKGH